MSLAQLRTFTHQDRITELLESGKLTAGAGIPSSPAEIRYAIESPQPQRRRFDLIETMQTRYLMPCRSH